MLGRRFGLPISAARRSFVTHVKRAALALRDIRRRAGASYPTSRSARGAAIVSSRLQFSGSRASALRSVTPAYLHRLFTARRPERPAPVIALVRGRRFSPRQRAFNRHYFRLVGTRRAPTPRVLTGKLRFLSRKQQARRRYTPAYSKALIDPLAGPKVFLPTRYDYDLRVGVFSARRRHRLVNNNRNLNQ